MTFPLPLLFLFVREKILLERKNGVVSLRRKERYKFAFFKLFDNIQINNLKENANMCFCTYQMNIFCYI